MVDYSLGIVSKSKGFRKSLDGAITKHHNTTVVTATLRGASATLASHFRSCISVEKGFEGETQLRELGVDCEGIARSLLQELGLGAIRKCSERCNGIYCLVHSQRSLVGQGDHSARQSSSHHLTTHHYQSSTVTPAMSDFPTQVATHWQNVTGSWTRTTETSTCLSRDTAGHNHIVHAIFAVMALGGSPQQLRDRYDDGATMQRPIPKLGTELLEKLEDPDTFYANLSERAQYHTFQTFFERKMAEKGWRNVLQEYLFARSKITDWGGMSCSLL